MNVIIITQFNQQIFSNNPFKSLTSTQKTITAIVLVALSCIAIAILFYRRCSFSATVAVQNTPQKTLINQQTNNEPTTKINSTIAIQNTPTTPTPIQHAQKLPFQKHLSNGVVEQGKFFNGQLYGKGKRTYPNGMGDIKEIEGIFKFGVLDGAGSVTFFDGRIQRGTFVNGYLVEGIKQFPDEKGYKIDYEKGKFQNDRLTGKGEVRFKNRKVHEGNFEDGRLKIQVFVKGLTRTVTDYTLFIDEPITKLQEKIASGKVGILQDQQRLIFAGVQLASNRTFDSYGISDQSTIHLVLRLGGD